MKKFTTLLTMAFIALMSISFTSCDDDYYWHDDYYWREFNKQVQNYEMFL